MQGVYRVVGQLESGFQKFHVDTLIVFCTEGGIHDYGIEEFVESMQKVSLKIV